MATINKFCLQHGCYGLLAAPLMRGDGISCHPLHIFSKCFMSLLKGYWKTNIHVPCTHISNTDIRAFSYHCEVISWKIQLFYWLAVTLLFKLRALDPVALASITWELVTHAESWLPPPPTPHPPQKNPTTTNKQTNLNKNLHFLTRSPIDSYAIKLEKHWAMSHESGAKIALKIIMKGELSFISYSGTC